VVSPPPRPLGPPRPNSPPSGGGSARYGHRWPAPWWTSWRPNWRTSGAPPGPGTRDEPSAVTSHPEGRPATTNRPPLGVPGKGCRIRVGSNPDPTPSGTAPRPSVACRRADCSVLLSAQCRIGPWIGPHGAVRQAGLERPERLYTPVGRGTDGRTEVGRDLGFCPIPHLLVELGLIDYDAGGCSTRRGARAAESDSLLMSWLGRLGPGVQIPPSPLHLRPAGRTGQRDARPGDPGTGGPEPGEVGPGGGPTTVTAPRTVTGSWQTEAR
jgi:hypothetical protein